MAFMFSQGVKVKWRNIPLPEGGGVVSERKQGQQIAPAGSKVGRDVAARYPNRAELPGSSAWLCPVQQ